MFPVSFFRKQSKWRHFIKVAGLPSRFYKPLKMNTSYKTSKKTSLVDRVRCAICYLQLSWKRTPPEIFRVIFPIFQIARRAFLEESFFSKVIGEISALYNFVRNSITSSWCVPKSSSSGNFKKSTVCNITKAKPRPIFLNVRQKSVMQFFLSELHAKNYRFHTGKVGPRTLRCDTKVRT